MAGLSGLLQPSQGFPAGVSALTGLSDFPASYVGSGSFILRVNAGETAVEFVDNTSDFLTQYVNKTVAGTITAVHTFNPGSATPWILLGANATGQLITGLNADELDGNDESAFALLAGRVGGQTLRGAPSGAGALTLSSDGPVILSPDDVTLVTATDGATGARRFIVNDGGTLTGGGFIKFASNRAGGANVEVRNQTSSGNTGFAAVADTSNRVSGGILVTGTTYGDVNGTIKGALHLSIGDSSGGGADRPMIFLNNQRGDFRWRVDGPGDDDLIAQFDGNGDISYTQSVRTVGSGITHITVTSAAHTGLTASSEYTAVNFNLSAAMERDTGAVATDRTFRVQGPTYKFVAASVVTASITWDVTAATAGANATITNRLAARFTGAVGFDTTDLGSGDGAILAIANATTVPTTNPTGGGVLYTEAGALKWRGSGGSITTLGIA